MRSDAFHTFGRPEWARLRASTPLTLTRDDLKALRGLNDKLTLEELADVYLRKGADHSVSQVALRQL